MTMPDDALLAVENLHVHYPVRGGLFGRTVAYTRAVEDVSFSIAAGETFGLVGESGCGKTTVGFACARMITASAGRVRFAGVGLNGLKPDQLRAARRDMQLIFQDPYSSLNPKLTVAESIGEPLLVHGMARGDELRRRVGELLEIVGLRAAHGGRYPHQFSGGQRQRLVIARALALRPKLIICDEPVSALDVSVQSQILNLLNDLQREFGLAYLFISHDLSVVKNVSDRVAVMYLGRIVELADSERLFARPLHPYTEALLSAIPIPDPLQQRRRTRIILQGELPDPAKPPAGCAFHPRCVLAREICKRQTPVLRPLSADHSVSCHLRG